jgi:hypothetical protein
MRTTTIQIIGVILFFFSYSLNAETIKTRKWETIDIPFSVRADIPHPFEVELSCTFTGKKSDTLVVPGFYNGNRQWIVRFTPNATGRWKCTSQSTIKKMDGIEKNIEVSGNNPDNPGPVQINSDNPRLFSYENGDPYNLLAFEADWLFALDYGDPELPKTRQLVSTIADNGFNQIVMNVYAFDASWKKDPGLLPEYNFSNRLDIFPFKGDNENPDYSGLNIDFFKHLDRVIGLLGKKDIISHLMIYVWNKKVNWPEAGSPADNMYFDYVVKRYQAYPNIIWDISKEALGYGHTDMKYISNRIDRLRALDAYDRLLTVHDKEYCTAFPEKVDFISVQSWKAYLYSEMLSMAKKFPDKPVFNIEHGGYEESPYVVFRGNFEDPAACLARNYYCAFAGVYSTYYWQGTSWYTVIYDPFENELEPKPKFKYYMYFADFLDRIEFHKLIPSNNHGTTGICLINRAEDTYVHYIPSENASVVAQNIGEADSLKITWFNPLTGEYTGAEKRKRNKAIHIYKKNPGQAEVAIIRLDK